MDVTSGGETNLDEAAGSVIINEETHANEKKNVDGSSVASVTDEEVRGNKEDDWEESDAKESDVEESDVEESDAEESGVEESDAEESDMEKSYAEESDADSTKRDSDVELDKSEDERFQDAGPQEPPVNHSDESVWDSDIEDDEECQALGTMMCGLLVDRIDTNAYKTALRIKDVPFCAFKPADSEDFYLLRIRDFSNDLNRHLLVPATQRYLSTKSGAKVMFACRNAEGNYDYREKFAIVAIAYQTPNEETGILEIRVRPYTKDDAAKMKSVRLLSAERFAEMTFLPLTGDVEKYLETLRADRERKAAKKERIKKRKEEELARRVLKQQKRQEKEEAARARKAAREAKRLEEEESARSRGESPKEKKVYPKQNIYKVKSIYRQRTKTVKVRILKEEDDGATRLGRPPNYLIKVTGEVPTMPNGEKIDYLRLPKDVAKRFAVAATQAPKGAEASNKEFPQPEQPDVLDYRDFADLCRFPDLENENAQKVKKKQKKRTLTKKVTKKAIPVPLEAKETSDPVIEPSLPETKAIDEAKLDCMEISGDPVPSPKFGDLPPVLDDALNASPTVDWSEILGLENLDWNSIPELPEDMNDFLDPFDVNDFDEDEFDLSRLLDDISGAVLDNDPMLAAVTPPPPTK